MLASLNSTIVEAAVEAETDNEFNEHVLMNTLTGDKYIGTINEDGLMDGVGKYFWDDGAYYEGEFLENMITGKGVMFW